MSDEFNVLFCVNEGFSQHMAVAMASVIQNTDAPLRILVVGTLTDATKQRIQLTSGLRDGVLLNFIDPGETLFDETFPIPPHLSFDAYVRLWVDDFYDESVERVLYLDADLVVEGDITELFELDLGDASLGAAPIPWFDRDHIPNFDRSGGYFNSGVLLFNMPVWRRKKAHQRVIDFIVQNSEILRDPDQDALNACLQSEKYDLPLEWNTMNRYFRGEAFGDFSVEDVNRIAGGAKIIHYTGVKGKPWFYLTQHPRPEPYYKYLALTPWRDYTPPDKTPLNVLKRTISNVLPMPVKRALGALLGR